MKKDNDRGNLRKRIWSGRAAQIFAVTATVFLCFLTVFEYVALRMEWDIPALQMITGDSDSYIFKEYRNEEMALDQSTENILFKEGYQGDELENEPAAADGEVSSGNSNEDAVGINAESPKESENNTVDGSTESPEEGKTNTADDNTESPEEGKTNTKDGSTESPKDAKSAENSKTTEDAAGTKNQETTEAEEEEEFPYYIKVNRQQNCITIYTKDENGEYTVPYKAMICSTGLYNATPCGTFHLSTKYLWRELFGNVYGQYATRITGGVLFHSVPYYKKSKSSLCTEKYNKLGQQASMGCVRLTVEDAKWIAENCPSGTTVEIYDDKDNPGPLGKPEAMKIDTDNPNKGWDPTDPDIENPWHELSDDE